MLCFFLLFVSGKCVCFVSLQVVTLRTEIFPLPFSWASVQPLSLSNKHPPNYVEYTGRSHRTKKTRSIFLSQSQNRHFSSCCKFAYAAATWATGRIYHGHDNMLSAIFSSPKYDDHVMQTWIVRWTPISEFRQLVEEELYQLHKISHEVQKRQIITL